MIAGIFATLLTTIALTYVKREVKARRIEARVARYIEQTERIYRGSK